MHTARRMFGTGVINGLIFVVGGLIQPYRCTCEVEYFDTNTNQWYKAKGMDTFRTGLSCCVVANLQHMANFTVPRDVLPVLDLECGLVVSEESS